MNLIIGSLALSLAFASIRTENCDLSSLIEKCDFNFATTDFNYKFNTWVLVPFDPLYKFSKERVQPAIEKAINDVRLKIESANKTSLLLLLKKSTVNLMYEDTECDAETSTKVVADIQDISQQEKACNNTGSNVTDVEIIFGMTCDYAAGRVATLGNHWNWLLIYPGTRTSNFDKKKGSECCSTMVRPGITRSDFGRFIADLYKRYNWNTSVVVYTKANSHSAPVSIDTSTDCSTLVGGVTDSFRDENWVRYEYYNLTSRDTDDEAERDVQLILGDIKQHARVSIWCVGRRTMRRVMAAAKNLSMTSGDFAFIYIDLYNSNLSYFWTDDDDQLWQNTSKPDDPIDPNVSHLDDYLRSLTVVTLKTSMSDEYKAFSDEIKQEIFQSSNGRVKENGHYINPFITYYYDGMRILLYGIIKLFCQKSLDISDGEQFAEALWGVQIKSIGRNITIARNGDRILDYSVLDMNVKTKQFEIVLNYYGQHRIWEELGAMDWPGESPPVNVPDCGYRGEKCEKPTANDYNVCEFCNDWQERQPEKSAVQCLSKGCNKRKRAGVGTGSVLYYALFSCVAALLVLCIALAILFRRMKRERRLQKMMWKIRWDDLEWTHNRKTSSHAGSFRGSSHSIASSNGSHPHFTGKQVFTKTAVYKDEVVAVKDIKRKRVILDRSLLIDLEEIYAIDHEHVCKFVGAVIESPHVSILTEYCARGSLQDLLEDNTEYEMEEIFKKSLLSDIISGIQYLHKSYFKCHGNLKSSNCLIDNRFLVKLTDYGLSKLREGSRTDSVTGHKYYESKLWMAPELLRGLQLNGTTKGDIYSFAIIAQEIIYRKGVFYTKENYTPQEILHRLTCPSSSFLPLRPTLENNDSVIVDPELRSLIKECWQEDPAERPDINEIHKKFKKMRREKNLVDSLLKRLEHYSSHLEEKVEERTEQYKAERERADMLLYQMLPQAVADQLKRGKNVLPMAFEQVTIFFSDVVGFTAISHNSKPMDVVNMLNDLYTMFDQIIDVFDVYKVETIGDAYMVVSGLPEKNGNIHAREIARMSLCLLDCVKNKFQIRHMPSTQLKLRVGIHTGPVVAGVVGLKMPRYCLFGDTVNTASRMESNGKAFAIHVSPKTKAILDDFGTFHLEQREDEVFLKGLGTWKTWWLTGEEPTKYDPMPKPDEKIEVFERSNQIKNTGAVSFETESTLFNDSIPPANQKTRSGSSISPLSIMKENRTTSKAADGSGLRPFAEKRHRSGVVSNSRLHEFFGFDEVSQNDRKIKIAQLNSELGVLNPEYDSQELSNHLQSNCKVQFNTSSNSTDIVDSNKVVRISGRDSGIEMGYDNPVLLDDPSSEDDYL